MYAIDIANQSIIWSYPTVPYGNDIKCGPVVTADGSIYFGSDDNNFYAINYDGTLRWMFTSIDRMEGAAVIGSDGTIYTGDNDLNFYAFVSPIVPTPLSGAPQAPSGCPGSPKYSGDPVQLRTTPNGGIGPYLVEFYKDEVPILFSRLTNPLVITDNPTSKSIIENTEVGGTYILNDIDIANAVGGLINFSVYIEDSCPTGPMNCGSTCTISVGCVAPVCNFTVA